jgi:predicted dinucleotide-binding enzyme
MDLRRRGLLVIAACVLAAAVLPFSARAQDAEGKMKIGIIGSGDVGSAIGAAWVRAGHEVMFSSRHIEHDRELAARLGEGARAGTPREAAEFGEVVMVSVPYRSLPDVGKEVGDLLKGKVVIDTCNPFPSRDGEIAEWARGMGAGLASAELLPGARLVRAFNAVGAGRMGSAWRDPGRYGMPIASDDAEAAEIASRLIRDVGYEPVLIGGLDKGKHLVPGTALAGEQSPEEIRRIAAELE